MFGARISNPKEGNPKDKELKVRSPKPVFVESSIVGAVVGSVEEDICVVYGSFDDILDENVIKDVFC